MILTGYFLLIAAQLAVLTYYLGVLLYMLPIPVRGVKRWAPTLIQDSLWASILMTLYSALLSFSDSLARLSGHTLSEIIAYMELTLEKFILMNYALQLLVGVASIAHSLVGRIFSIITFPFSLVIQGIVTTAATVVVLASIISAAKAKLTALAIALISIPFRIGRNAGASLLSFILVSNIMLPFLPQWINLISSSVGSEQTLVRSKAVEVLLNNTEPVHVWGEVKDAYNYRPPVGLVKFINSNGAVFQFIIHVDGCYYVTKPLKMLPSGSYRVEVEYLSVLLNSSKAIVNLPRDARLTYELDEAKYRMDITVERDAVFIEPIGLMIVKGCNIENVYQSLKMLKLKCTPLSGNVRIDIYSLGANDVKLQPNTLNGVYNYYVNISEKPWRGVRVYVKTITLEMANASTALSLEFYKNIDYHELYQLNDLELSEGMIYPERSLEDIAIDIIVNGITFPLAVFSYLTVMSMVSLSLARVIGASYPRVIFD